MHNDITRGSAANFGRVWWLIALVGLASLVAGGILVAKPSHSLATLAVIFGIFMVLDGIAEMAGFGPGVENRALAAILGVLGVIVGLVLIRHPTHAVAVIGLLIGIWLVVAGLVRLVRAIAGEGNVVLSAVFAVVQVAVGIAVVSDPHIGYATLAVLVGIWLIANGIGAIMVAFLIRGARSELSARPGTPSQSLT